MNPGVLQCKNCWKWGYMTGVCHIQETKCVRCNSPHLSEHHCHFAWCCKANNKINPPRLEMKKGELCPTCSSVLTAKANTKLIQTIVLFGSIISIRNSMQKNMLKFGTTKETQLIQL